MPEQNNNEMTAAQMLLTARTIGRRKREISTIAKQLCIREEYLVALEQGDYHLIPEVVYVLGFARNYAMELGLDPIEVVNKIKCEMGMVDVSEEEDALAVSADAKQSTPKRNFFAPIMKFAYRHWKWMLAGLAALIILVLGIIFISGLSVGDTVDSATPVAGATVAEPAYKAAVREKFGTENAAGARIVIQATQESWVKIEDARGNTVFSRVLVPGDVYFVPNGDKIRGTFGNAGGVDVWVDGKLAPKLGASHTRRADVAMNPDSLMVND